MVNLNQRWQYLEADDVCAECGTLITQGCPCPNKRVVSGGPGHVITMTEAEIIDQYFPYWCGQMIEAGKTEQITLEGCIEDWVVVNWAEKAPNAV